MLGILCEEVPKEGNKEVTPSCNPLSYLHSRGAHEGGRSRQRERGGGSELVVQRRTVFESSNKFKKR